MAKNKKTDSQSKGSQNDTLPEGFIKDFVSGQIIRDTPEERDAVQPFSKILFEDYGYPLDHLRTRPQFRVKSSPSDVGKSYPVDIAVFTKPVHDDDNAYIIVECKKKNRKDGRGQLEDYLRFSRATMGVWFNGEGRLFIQKTESKGKVIFKEIPNIPLYGQRVEDIGQFKRRDLKPSHNLKPIFKSIRNYLAANAVGITRDEIFAQQLINLIFCKIYDERFTQQDSTVQFRAGINESSQEIATRINELFQKVKKQYDDVISIADKITLDDDSIRYVVGELQIFSITESERDAVGEAFEIFIGPSLKGGQGQFFTPRNVVKMIIDMVDPKPGQRIIDPACGSGGFLVEGLRHVWNHVEINGKDLDWPADQITEEKSKVAIKYFRGIDKDSFLSKVAKAYMAILGDGRGGVYCENSLENPNNWSPEAQTQVPLGSFDVVITNPPFGKKLAIDNSTLLKQYDLGYKWKLDKDNDEYCKGKLCDKQPPQILFIERCLDLLKPGGTLGIVLLESTFGMPKYKYIVDFLEKHTNIKSIVTMPENLFQPHTHAKTCVVICTKTPKPNTTPIFMCDVKWCGHDSRGNPTYRTMPDGNRILLDDIPTVANLYHAGPDSL